jgi:hypothetical protein
VKPAPKTDEITQELRDLPIHPSQVHAMKMRLGRYYEGTFKRLLEKIVAGRLARPSCLALDRVCWRMVRPAWQRNRA